MPGFELFGDQERASVDEVLSSGVLMRYGFEGMRKGHWKARELEIALTRRMQVKHAQLVSSGTAALSTAFASAGIGAGDEVILPVFTFVASFEAVLSVGAIPVLAEIDDTLTLCPKDVRRKITGKTRCIMPVHMCGSMARMQELQQIAEEANLLIIEDACQAIGGSFKGKPLGSLGDLGCFSFDYVKTITCGEGGAVITNNTQYYHHADHYSDHGHDHVGKDRGAEGHPFLGYNYRISELHAAVGVAQIHRLDEFLAIQKKNYTQIRQQLASLEGLQFRTVPEGGVENYSFLNVFLPDEDRARKANQAFKEAALDGVFYWYDNNWHYHRKWEHLKQGISLGALPKDTVKKLNELETETFPQSDHWMGRNLSFLIKIGWSDAELESRAATCREVLEQVLA